MIDRYYHGNVPTLKVVAAAIEGRTKASQGVADFLKGTTEEAACARLLAFIEPGTCRLH